MGNGCCAPPPGREPEASARRACPSCGRQGKGVPARTVRLHVVPGVLPAVDADEGYRFCAAPGCPVVYYGARWATIVRTEELRTRVGAKVEEDPVPVCYCFGFTERRIADDLLANGRSTVRDYIRERVRRGDCACEVTNPSGRCCLGDVGRAIARALPALVSLDVSG